MLWEIKCHIGSPSPRASSKILFHPLIMWSWLLMNGYELFVLATNFLSYSKASIVSFVSSLVWQGTRSRIVGRSNPYRALLLSIECGLSGKKEEEPMGLWGLAFLLSKEEFLFRRAGWLSGYQLSPWGKGDHRSCSLRFLSELYPLAEGTKTVHFGASRSMSQYGTISAWTSICKT